MANCNHRDEQNQCTYKPSKRGKHEVCTKCGDRFPCANAQCTHFDCQMERGQKPKCYYCEKRMDGAKDEEWTTQNRYGSTMTVHYSCKEAAEKKADLAQPPEMM
jgi:hypothetical protein